MKKSYKIEVDCANCARKMEDAANKTEGVREAVVNFMAQKMILEAPDDQFADILKLAAKTIAEVEPDCRIVM